MARCPHCQADLTGTPFCGHCGNPLTANTAHASHGGVAVAGPGARVKVKNSGNSWDTRPQTQFHSDDRPVSGWLELAASLITLGAAALGGFAAVAKLMGDLWVVLLLICAAVTITIGFLAFHFLLARATGHSVVRLSGWVLGVLIRRDSGRLMWNRPTAVCMFCPPSRRSTMTLQWRDNDTQWVCAANGRQHVASFDWTQV